MKFYKAWIRAALIRALRTMAQSAIAVIGSKTVLMGEVNWAVVVSAVVVSGILSILTSLTGLPECQNESCKLEDSTEPI